MTTEQIQEVLAKHSLWLQNTGGARANLRGANLRGADLRGADLGDANLRGADLGDANLGDANLRGANLRGANLIDANLIDANLECANLGGANLRGANLRGANLIDTNLPDFQIPQHGELRVYKKVQRKIVHLKIPSWAKRTASLVGRKCRASAAVVLAIENDQAVQSTQGVGVTYVIGQTVYPDQYDPDIRIECSHGIHFFLTREEAEKWPL